MNKPIGKIYYDANDGGFVYDAKYTKSIRGDLEQLQEDLEEKQRELAAAEVGYKKAISSADAKLNSKNYEAAKAGYTAAMKLKPGEQYPKDQIQKIDAVLVEEAAAKAEEEISARSRSKTISRGGSSKS